MIKSRDRQNLGIILLFFSPACMVLGLLANDWRGIPLLVACVGWVLAIGWNLVTGRHFAQDIVPFIMLPYGFFRVFRTLWGATLVVITWVYRLIRRIPNTHSELKDRTVPRDWPSLLADEKIMRKLLSGRYGVIGHNASRVVLADLHSAKHLLITGVTGEGKTTVAWSMILSLLTPGPGALSKLAFSIHDPKGVVGLHFKPLADAYPQNFETFTKLDDSYAALERLIVEMQERTHKLGEARVLNVDDLGLHHKIIVIDEPQLWYARNKDYEQKVLELVTAGRQAGFHVIILTPYAKSTIISTDYRPNFRVISGRLPAHAVSVVGMEGVTKLGQYEFLYQESEIDPPIWFKTFHITPGDIHWAVQNALFSFNDPEEVAVRIFVTTPNCGIRTILREGANYCKALHGAQAIKTIPFPWSEIEVNGNMKTSQAAWQWGISFMDRMREAGIASHPTTGRARGVLTPDVADALAKWKEYKKSGGGVNAHR